MTLGVRAPTNIIKEMDDIAASWSTIDQARGRIRGVAGHPPPSGMPRVNICIGGGWRVVMAKKRGSPQKRLARAIERTRKPNPLLSLVRQPQPAFSLDYNNKRIREIAANLALTLGEGPTDAPLKRAFDAFGLNSKDPFHWRHLLQELAAVLFYQPSRDARARGAPPKWNNERRKIGRAHV